MISTKQLAAYMWFYISLQIFFTFNSIRNNITDDIFYINVYCYLTVPLCIKYGNVLHREFKKRQFDV